MNELFFPAIESVHSSGQGADPELSVRIFINAHDPVVGQAVGVVFIVFVVGKGPPVVTIETAEIGPDPELVVPPGHQANDDVVAQAIGIIWGMQVLAKAVMLPIEGDESSAIAAQPAITR